MALSDCYWKWPPLYHSVSGAITRLLIELGLFGAAAWMLLDLGYLQWAIIFGVAVVAHYILSFDRITWLLKQK